MTDADRLSVFEAERPRLRGLAFRLLGSQAEAEDAVQEAWVRLQGAGGEVIRNPEAWLTTVTGRIALTMLRSRRRRREVPLDDPQSVGPACSIADPEEDAAMAQSVGVALTVVLNTLTPAERVAFVLHDLFALPHDLVASVLGKTIGATRQTASRARRRVHGAPPVGPELRVRQREIVAAFFAASQAGDFDGLMRILHPDVRLTVDMGSALTTFRGAETIARRALMGSRREAGLLLADGDVAIAALNGASLSLVLMFKVSDAAVSAIRIITRPAVLGRLRLAILDPAEITAARPEAGDAGPHGPRASSVPSIQPAHDRAGAFRKTVQ